MSDEQKPLPECLQPKNIGLGVVSVYFTNMITRRVTDRNTKKVLVEETHNACEGRHKTLETALECNDDLISRLRMADNKGRDLDILMCGLLDSDVVIMIKVVRIEEVTQIIQEDTAWPIPKPTI